MNDIRILTAENVNWKDYKNLRLEALQKEPQAFGSSYEREQQASDGMWQHRLEQCKKVDGQWLVFASMNEKLAGMVGAYQTDEDKKNSSAQVIGVYVKESLRGQGAAHSLMKAIINQLKRADIRKAYLCVNKNQLSAVRLYERFGFIITSQEKRQLGDGNYYDEYDMEKVL